jgi:hypothetical protein
MRLITQSYLVVELRTARVDGRWPCGIRATANRRPDVSFQTSLDVMTVIFILSRIIFLFPQGVLATAPHRGRMVGGTRRWPVEFSARWVARHYEAAAFT